MHRLKPVVTDVDKKLLETVVCSLKDGDDEFHQSTFNPTYHHQNQYFVLYYKNELMGFSALEYDKYFYYVDFWVSVYQEARHKKHAFIFSAMTLKHAVDKGVDFIYSDVYIKNHDSMELHLNIIDKYNGSVELKTRDIVTFCLPVENYHKLLKGKKL